MKSAEAETLPTEPTSSGKLSPVLRAEELREEMSTILHLGMRYFGLEAGAISEVAGDLLVVHARRSEGVAGSVDLGPAGLSADRVLAIHDSSSAGWDHGRRLRAVGAAAYIGAPIPLGGGKIAMLEFTGGAPRAVFNQSDIDMIMSLVRWVQSEVHDVRNRNVTAPPPDIVPRVSGIRSLRGASNEAESPPSVVPPVSALVKDLRELGRLASAENDVELEPCTIVDVCDAALASVREQAEQKAVELSFTVGAREQTVRADAQRLHQMLHTLLANAVRLSNRGGCAGIEVVANEEAGTIAFTVWDDGPSLSNDDHGKLVSPFSESDATMSQPCAGLGVGLTLVHKLTDLHGGSLTVEAGTNGNRFTVQLPNYDEEGPSSSRSSWQNLFIVVIDPCAAMEHTVTPYLFDRGHRVFVASTYEQGVSFVSAYRPDVVVIDARAEEPRALEAIRRIRAAEDASIAGTPIVAACGLLLPGYAERCRAAGTTEYFERPLRTREIVMIVEEHGPYAKAC